MCKVILIYNEETNGEVWSLYITKIDQLPNQIDKKFIEDNFTYVCSFQCPPLDYVDTVVIYEKFQDDSCYIKLQR